ncbi:MAG: PAS domain-containing hybrid sensor histidine kinase/response regulator, partial [Planctomycetota bacterium]
TRDITERKEAEDAKRASEEKYRTLAEQSLQGIAIAQGLPPRLVFANQAFAEILGYTRLELVSLTGEDMRQMLQVEDRERFLDVYRNLVEGRKRPQRYEFPIIRRDGKRRMLEVYAKRIIYLDEPAVQATLVDITKRKKAQDDLRDSEEKYRSVVEQSLQGIVIAQGDPPTIKFVNKAFAELMGYSEEEFLSLPPEGAVNLVHPDDKQALFARYTDRLAGNLAPGPLEFRALKKDGNAIWLQVISSQIRYRGETAVQAAFVDIDDRKRAEEALRASEESYRRLLDLNPAGIAIHSEGKMVYANRMALHLLGVASVDDIRGKPALDFVHPDYHEIVTRRFQKMQSPNQVAEPIEEKFLKLDGSVLDVVVTGLAIPSFEGKPATQVVFLDITEQKDMEKALRRSKERFRALTESTSDWIWEIDAQGRYTYASPKVKDLLGYDRGEVVGRNFLEFKDPVEAERNRRTFSENVADPGPFVGHTTENLRKDGSRVTIETSGVPFFGPGGELKGFRGIDRDITERRKVLEALRRSEARYRSTIDSMQDGIHVVDSDLQILLVNERFKGWAEELGLTREFVGKGLFEAFPFLPESIREEYTRVFASGSPLVTDESHDVDGQKIYTKTMKIPIIEERRTNRVVTVVRDVTDTMTAAAALKESEERYRILFEHSPIGISVTDLQTGRALYVNPAFCEMLGYTTSEFMGLPFHAMVADDAREGVIGRFDRLKEGEATFATATPFLRKDGTVVHLNCNAGPAVVDGRNCSIGFHVDVTQVIEVMEERRKLQRQMQQTQKLESLGVLAGGIAHDFNNLLTGVLGNVELAKLEIPSENTARPYLTQIETATQRLADLTNQMLAYSGKGHFVVEPIRLSNLVEEMGRLLQISISKDVDLAYDFSPDLPLIEADPTQIRQIVMNLITNASESIGPDEGRIVARTFEIRADRATLSETVLGEDLPEGEYAVLEVADTGTGMDGETLSKIFDPFFTTKFTGRGLGLAAVLGIVKGHAGAIQVESEPGEGTTFRIYFPVTDKKRRAGSAVMAAPQTWRGEGTILIIDDEEPVRLVARDMLRKAGFDTLSAANGETGIELLRTHAGDIRAVLLDLTMPGMGGEETFEALRELEPEIPVILFSGYSEREATYRFDGKGLSGFIQKPFYSKTLVAALRAILE